MGGESTTPGPGRPPGPGEGEATQTFLGRDPVTGSQPTEPVSPQPRLPTEVAAPRLPTAIVPPRPPAEVMPARPSANVVRYGPGVPVILPAGQGGLTAERVWRGHPPAPGRRPARLRQILGSALTVILLAASGVVLYLRFHHAPFNVTGVVISQRTLTGCGVDVTGRITTNGAAGTVSYQWLFRPGRQQPQPLSQSVITGQHAAYVSVAVEGSGHGTASQTVTLQVLGPDRRTASTAVVVSC